MTAQKERIEAAIRHIQTAADVDPWAMELAVDALERDTAGREKNGGQKRHERSLETSQNNTQAQGYCIS